MGGFVWSQFRFRRNRVLVLALAILVAAVGFVLLTSSAKTSSLQIHGTIKTNFRPAYDILVRPRGSKTPIERQQGLVPPNYLSGIFGGITLRQWRQILRMRGVDVAAPVANIGYVLAPGYPQLPLNRYLTKDCHQIIRIDTHWLAHGGHSRYSGGAPGYVYVTCNRARVPHFGGVQEFVAGQRRASRPCDGFMKYFRLREETSPFQSFPYISCLSTRSDVRLRSIEGTLSVNDWRGKGVGTVGFASFPLLLAAIDPVEEGRLIDVRRTIVGGRYLRPNEDAELDKHGCLICGPIAPVLVGTQTYVDEPLVFDVKRLGLPNEPALLRRLEASEAPAFLASLPSRTVAIKRYSSSSMYAHALADWLPSAKLQLGRGAVVSEYWTLGGVRYRQVAKDRLRALPVENPRSIWRNNEQANGWLQAPPGSRDTSFRPLTLHNDSQTACGALVVGLRAVGRFDQRRLPGFSPLSLVPLETYSPPQVKAADAATRRVLGGRPLGPTMTLGDYVAQPPFMLTSLRSAVRLLGRWKKPPSCVFNERPFIFQNTSHAAPVSVIRVRVKGVSGPDALSLERIKVVAQRIHDETGLDVDITAGSSPHPLVVELPAGKFGRPELLLREGWSRKGVSVSFLRALDRKDLLLFVLILVICGFFLSNGALAAVRARRAEIGTLRTLGWPSGAIFGAVLAEILGVGLIAGAAGSVLALGLVALLDLHIDLWRVVLVIPLAVGLALVAGVVPALVAERGQPLDALRPPVAGRGSLGRVRSVLALALSNLRRLPARTVLGAAGLFVGVAALTVLIGIERSFGGTLVGTLLGNAISVQVRGSDFVAVGLTILLAAVSVADVLYLNIRERSAELATLRAVGWSAQQLRATVVLEALGIGLIGGGAGAALGLVLGAALLGVGVLPLLVAAAIAGTGGMAVAICASVVPLTQVARLTPYAVLATE